MGLDMYLKAERYVAGYEHNGPEAQASFNALREAAGLKPDQIDRGSPSATVKFIVGYWRKANQIHHWFVTHVQDDVDECRPHAVTRAQLSVLKMRCEQVLADNSKASELLPPRPGFFFGSTEVGEGYIQDLKDTIKIVDRVLALPDDWELEYRSSW